MTLNNVMFIALSIKNFLKYLFDRYYKKDTINEKIVV